MTDVYRGKVEASKKFSKILLYISFFPQLIAGPIIKYYSVSAQIEKRGADLSKVCQGMRRFIMGLSKKVLLADTLAVAVDSVFSLDSSELGMATAWIGAVAYMFQIYYDFSGYSDMAIGMGKIFGFDFAENFQLPYASSSIQMFWRRWHISLTDWFREYLYIPLGGNRKGKVRTWMNRMIVFFCTGLWHGADWTYVLWGVFHGVFISLETVFPYFTKRFKVLRHIYVLLVVCVGFVIFRSDTMEQAVMILSAMFTNFEWNLQIEAAMMRICDNLFLFVLVVSMICAMPVFQWIKQAEKHCTISASRVSYTLDESIEEADAVAEIQIGGVVEEVDHGLPQTVHRASVLKTYQGELPEEIRVLQDGTRKTPMSDTPIFEKGEKYILVMKQTTSLDDNRDAYWILKEYFVSGNQAIETLPTGEWTAEAEEVRTYDSAENWNREMIKKESELTYDSEILNKSDLVEVIEEVE